MFTNIILFAFFIIFVVTAGLVCFDSIKVLFKTDIECLKTDEDEAGPEQIEYHQNTEHIKTDEQTEEKPDDWIDMLYSYNDKHYLKNAHYVSQKKQKKKVKKSGRYSGKRDKRVVKQRQRERKDKKNRRWEDVI